MNWNMSFSLSQAKAQQGWLVAGTVGCPEPEIAPSSEIPITSCLDFLWEQPTLLVLGNEGSGLSREVQASCRLLLTILPGRQLPPGLESLNVSVAAGILLHTICSQRKSSLAEAKREQLPQDPKNPQPHQKGSEWLSTQDCPKDQKKRGRRGTDLDCLRCVCAGRHTQPCA